MAPYELKSSSYRDLCDDLKTLLKKGRMEAYQAVSEIANRTYWKVGRRLHRTVGEPDRRTSAEVLRRLAADLGVVPSMLYQAMKFYRQYPRGLPRTPDAVRLPWGSHVALLPVADPDERLYYLGRALDEGWSRAKLKRAIRAGLYQGQHGGRKGDQELERPAAGLHTYVGIVEKVVDGDTLDVRIDLGFDVWRVERLRLRGVDCAELNTAEGKEARAFVQSKLMDVPFVVFRTYKTDLYARYIADVFYHPTLEEKNDVYQRGAFLNQELLETGQAVSMF